MRDRTYAVLLIAVIFTTTVILDHMHWAVAGAFCAAGISAIECADRLGKRRKGGRGDAADE